MGVIYTYYCFANMPHIHIHMHVYTQLHPHTHTHMPTYTHTRRTHTHAHTHTHTRIHTHTHAHTHTHTHSGMLHFVGLKPQKEERLHWDAIQQSIRENQLQRRPGVWGGMWG